MKLLTYHYQGREDFGVLLRDGRTICPANAVCRKGYGSLAELIGNLSGADRRKLAETAAGDGPPAGKRPSILPREWTGPSAAAASSTAIPV